IGQPSSRTGENPPYGMSGGIEETSASCEARSAPRSYPTDDVIAVEHRCPDQRHGVEQPLPDARLHPVAEAGEDAVPVAERGRQIAPWTARADHPQDGLDKQAVVLAASPRITGLAPMLFTLRFGWRR